MELRQLKTFVTIAKQGSFVQTADALGYAQSTITNHIQNLENEMGVRLFERLGHRICLTAQGKALLSYAEQVIKLTSEAGKVIANPDVPQGVLTIGTNESLGTYRLPTLLQAYRKAYPKVEMVLKFVNCDAIYDDIRNNRIDVGVIINNKVWEYDLIAEDISREQMLFLAAPNHPLAQKEKVRPYDLAEICVILTEPGCSYRLTLEKFLKDFRTTPQSILEASSIETIKQLIMLGLGISMLPRFTVEKELAEGQIQPLRWDEPIPNYTVQLLYHKDKWISPTLQAFFQVVRTRQTDDGPATHQLYP
ncbi:HTH-type transcriptional regulator GltR [Sporomusa ovata DSM 2662]|uniref:Chromosome initiation inhibitor n=1 Tax=Sporomusa ovata TaxID=2378 RepID=A0A0U1L5I8_9FIRM|nr:LysR substrate-binding domain-containing protein [Sporomusa ovata]EQB24596.1 HTH-type transcriptional regulator, LysR family [Sporomusa ovata DSM 2662]CQR74956.1 Chromosome initiation inhibitor [Sporomusa ovata]